MVGHPPYNAYHPINGKEHDWPNFFRLLSISGAATIASIGNIFTISSIIVDDLLRKKGNSLLVSVTLADLLVTALILPAMSVAILAQMEDSENLCTFQYFCGTMSCITSSVFTAAIGLENYLRLRALRSLEQSRLQRRGQPVNMSVQIAKQSVCSQSLVTILNLSLWGLSAIVVIVHSIFMPDFSFAICQKSPNETLLFNSLLVLGSFLLFFVTMSLLFFGLCICIMRSWAKPMPYITSREFSLIKSNSLLALVRFLFWFPSIMAAILTQMERTLSNSPHEIMPIPTSRISFIQPTTLSSAMSVSNKGDSIADLPYATLQRLAFWSVILPACLGSFVYACTNPNFRNSFIELLNYSFCKTNVTLRRTRDNLRCGNDVRVHIIPGYNIYSSSTGHSETTATPPRLHSFKCGPLMSYSRRDVYEL